MKLIAKLFSLAVVVVSLTAFSHAQITTVTASHLEFGPYPISTGTVTLTPVNIYGLPIAFADGAGTQHSNTAFSCAVTSGAIVGAISETGSTSGTCQVPDATETNPSNILYTVQVCDGSTGLATSGKCYTLTDVVGISGTTWALDHYGPPAATTSVAPLQAVQGTSVPSSCTSPSVFTLVSGSSFVGFYTCVGGVYVAVSGGSSAVASVFGRTGAIAAQTGDYTVSQITGAAPLASPTFTGTPTVPGYETTSLAALLAPLASPTFTGTVTAPTFAGALSGNASTASNLAGTPALPNGTTGTTQTVGDNSTKLATDAFVLANAGSGGATSFSGLTGIATPAQLPAATPSAQGAVELPTGASTNVLGSAAMTSSTAYDSFGAATAVGTELIDTRPTLYQTTGKSAYLAASGTTTVFTVAPGNAGTITWLHVAIAPSSGSDYANLMQNTKLNIACDGGLVSVPFGLFFMTQDAPVPFENEEIDLPYMSSTYGQQSLNRRVNINYSNGCTISLVNASASSGAGFDWDTQYKSGAYTGPANMTHWNAVYAAFPNANMNAGSFSNPQLQIVPATAYSGGGQVESITQFATGGNLNYLEGSPTITIDGTLAIVGNGGEDFFGCSYYCNAGTLSNHTSKWGLLTGSTGLQTKLTSNDTLGYRFFTYNNADNVPFTSSLMVALANGWTASDTPTASLYGLVTYFTTNPNGSQVVFSPAAGTAYTAGQTVTLTEATSGAVICYTTDGSTPTATTAGTCSHGSVYSSPISLSTTPNYINAIGTLAGYNNSVPVNNLYALTAPIAFTGNKCSTLTSASSTSITCTITIATTGDVALFDLNALSYTGASATCGTISMIRSVSYNSGALNSVLFDVPNATAGSCTATFTYGAQTRVQVLGGEFSGVNTTTPINNTTCTSAPYCSAVGNSASLTGAALVTPAANQLVVSFAMFYDNQDGISPSTLALPFYGYTTTNPSNEGFSYGFVGTSGTSITPTFNAGRANYWAVSTVSLTQ